MKTSDKDKALILVVDDDAMMRSLLREALEAGDFRVEEAEDGAVAMSVYENLKPDLVLLDVLMPNMDGFETCTALRKLPGGDNLPIIMITGMDDIDSINRSYDAGATDFASKPLNLLILSHRVRYMLRAKRAFDDLIRSQSRLASAQKIAQLGNWERDLKTGEIRWSEEMFHLFEVDPGAFKPTLESLREHIHPEDWGLVTRAADQAIRREHPYDVDLRIILPDGRVRHVHEQAQMLADSADRVVGMEGTTQDITARKRAEDQIRFLAYYDGLTSLPNRSLFMERLNRALESARRLQSKFGTLFLDLDRFKRINDTLGHGVGDRLLVEVAERLKTCLRSSDTVARGDPLTSNETVARLGGDEFTALITDISRGEDGARVARRILEKLSDPFVVDEHEFQISGSIGISVYPDDGADMETLLKNADAAMYHAKEAGGGRYQFYNQSMNATALERLSLETSLRKALERNEFQLYFQPQIDAASGAIVGGEALLHWNHPDFGLVSPEYFIPLAEETGLILSIGEWLLDKACTRCREWSRAGHPSVRISVNLTGREFWQPQLPQIISRALKQAKLDWKLLELEIPENVLMKNPGEASHSLKQLRAMGLRTCIDDFGSGHSSLGYLTKFSIDTLKINHSFVRDITRDAGVAAITEAILSMARGLKFEIAALGVSDEKQVEFLKQRGCASLQGPLFGRPVPEEEFVRLLTDRARGAGRATGTG
jgi:diguanylate cyclase (GGDEF)-like protein